MVADDLGLYDAQALADMALTQFVWNIPLPVCDGFTH